MSSVLSVETPKKNFYPRLGKLECQCHPGEMGFSNVPSLKIFIVNQT